MTDRTLVFSGSETTFTCVDCNTPTNHRLVYVLYNIGDMVCDTHARRRKEAVPGSHLRNLPAKTTIVPMLEKATTGGRVA